MRESSSQTTQISKNRVIEKFSLGFCLMAVSDGHGVNGHLVSNYIKNHLPSIIYNFIKEHIEQQLIREESVVIALQKAFDKTNREIWDADIETSLSGSTTVSVLIKKEQIWTANVGDSRAIICRNQDGWKAIQITRDHKPSDEDEKQRIITAGGRIESQRGMDNKYPQISMGTPLGLKGFGFSTSMLLDWQ